MKKSKKPMISVIIPTKNSGWILDKCLGSVTKQTYKNIEIVLVDCGSTDDTIKIAKKYGAKIYKLYPNMCAQRNLGTRKAKGDYFIFLDSDIELSSTVVEECVEKTKEGLKVITFPEVIVGEGFWHKCREIEALCYLGDDIVEAPRFYKKKIFFELGGFDEKLNGYGDWDLREKTIVTGYKIGRIKSLTMHHEGKVDPIKRIRKKFNYGKKVNLYIKKYPRGSFKSIPFLRKAYFRNWKLLIKYPIHTLGFLFLKTGELIAVMISIVMVKFRSKEDK